MNDVRFCLRAVTLVGSLLAFYPTLPAQSLPDDGYAFSSHCFSPPAIQQTGGVVIQQKFPLPKDCLDNQGNYSSAAVTVVYSKQTTDQLLAALRVEINDLTKKATDAIAESVKNNSVKSGEIDALVKSIQDRLYEDTLRRVKADLAKSQTPTGAKTRKVTP